MEVGDQQFNAVLVQRSDVAPDLSVFRIEPVGWQLPEFKPGQFAVLGLPDSAPRVAGSEAEDAPSKAGIIKRAYSIASSSLDRDFLEFYIVMVPSGQLTPRIFALDIGDRLFLGPKIAGLFTLDAVDADRDIILIATGTGLAPYMSMLRTTLAATPRRRILVVHGARHSWDLGYRSELMALQRVCPNLSYVPVVSRPQEEPTPWQGASGYLQDAWSDGLIAESWGGMPSSDRTAVFLCGNPAMIEAIIPRLQDDGFRLHSRKSPGNVHVEKYW